MPSAACRTRPATRPRAFGRHQGRLPVDPVAAPWCRPPTPRRHRLSPWSQGSFAACGYTKICTILIGVTRISIVIFRLSAVDAVIYSISVPTESVIDGEIALEVPRFLAMAHVAPDETVRCACGRDGTGPGRPRRTGGELSRGVEEGAGVPCGFTRLDQSGSGTPGKNAMCQPASCRPGKPCIGEISGGNPAWVCATDADCA